MMLKQVSAKHFFEVIGPLNVSLTVEGNYPYTTLFKLRGNTEVGRIVDKDIAGFTISTHFIKTA